MMAAPPETATTATPRARGAVSQAPLGRECGGKAEVFGNVTYLNPVGILGTQLVPTPETRGGDQFGSAVAVRPASDGSGSRVFVSSPGADNGTAADSGRVHSFRFVTDVGWQQAMAFTMPKPAASDKLGAAIATDGDRVFASIDRNGGAVAVFPNDAFGHHGSCDAWNSCGDAQGCADAACRVEGFGRAVEFEVGSCQGLPAQGIRCNLFFGLPGLEYDADYRGCELPVAYNIRCLP
jgi:hypothetical protein